MDLALDRRPKKILKKVAADFVKAEVPAHQMTQWYKNKQTFQPQLLKKAAELGWLGMMLPEEYGGAGVSTMDCAVVFEALGHGPVPGPLFTSGILSAQMIFEACTEEQRKSLLPKICDGSSIVVPAITDKAAYWGAGSGRDSSVENSRRLRDERHQALCLRRRSRHELSLRRAHGGRQSGFSSRRRQKSRRDDHAARRLFRLRRRSALRSMSPFRLWISSDRAARAGRRWKPRWTKSLPILSAYQVGATQEVFDITCEYTRTRVVFGQPIGRFQRVQDHCVDISINLDMARWATYEAIWRIDSGMDGSRRGSRSESDGQRRLLSWDELRPHGLGRTGNRLQPSDDGAQRARAYALSVSGHARTS